MIPNLNSLKPNSFVRLSLVMACAIAAASSAFAQEVSQVKGTKALITLQGLPVSPGSEFYSVDLDGKKKSVLRITQVKGDRAVAEIVKGTAEVGHSLKPRAAATPTQTSNSRVQDVTPEEPTTSDERAKRPRGFLGQFFKRGTAGGVMGGITQSTMSLTAKKTISSAAVSEDLTMNGNSYNVLGLYDYDLSSTTTIRGRMGLQTFSVSASPSNAGLCSGSCAVSFNYLATEASYHYNFLTGRSRAWVGAGFSFLLAMTKSTSISNFDTSSPTNQMFLFGGGYDMSLGHGAFVPFSIEYGYFPGSSTVKASTLLFQAGYAWRY